MKIKISVFILVWSSVFAMAQAPDMFSYQAVVRNAQGILASNSVVGVKLSILQGSATGTVVYSETKTLTTNENGLFTTMIGSGPATVGTFSGILWGSGLYFTKTEIDPLGGTNYSIVATSQMLSVPYALYAKNAGNFANTTGFVHYPGELFGGGIVFYVYKDATGEHGLIVSTEDLCTTCGWSNVTTAQIGAAAQSTWDGASNTAAIIAQAGHTTSAAKLCVDYRGGGFSDWYLPAIDELSLLNTNLFAVKKALNLAGGANDRFYTLYSSTQGFGQEYSYGKFFVFSFVALNNNISGNRQYDKGDANKIQYPLRAIRKF